LGTKIPSFLHDLGNNGIQIDRDDTRRKRNIGISEWEEKHSPSTQVLGSCMRARWVVRVVPPVPAAIKLWAGQFLLEIPPMLARERPVKCLKLFDTIAQVR
jgi:hypothetical protein